MKAMYMHQRLKLLAVTLILAGLTGLVPINYYYLRNKAIAQHSSVPVRHIKLKPSAITGQPANLSVPSLGINLPVIKGLYDPASGQWTLSLDKAQFATPSTPPNNEAGNTLIYGHYRPEVFAYLHLITPGAHAVITTDNGYKFTYTFENTEAVEPTDTSIFSYKGKPRLTIQTCSGSFMQNRQMYYFRYDSYTKTNKA
jgi:LPXTG-site transpeptidase (sortase) family protein